MEQFSTSDKATLKLGSLQIPLEIEIQGQSRLVTIGTVGQG